MSTGEEAGVLVVKAVEGGIVRRVVLLDDAGVEVVLGTRFLGIWLIPGIARIRCARRDKNQGLVATRR